MIQQFDLWNVFEVFDVEGEDFHIIINTCGGNQHIRNATRMAQNVFLK